MHKRLKKALKALKLRLEDLSSKTGLSRNDVRHMSAGAKIITPELAQIIEDKTGISALWILLGRGGMFDKPTLSLSQSFGIDEFSRLSIPFYNTIKVCEDNGYINDEDSEIEIISLPKTLFKSKVGNNIDALRVYSDNMVPTIKASDIVFLDKSSIEIKDNKIYVLKYGTNITIKRLFIRKEDKVLLSSDNNTYPDEEISIDNGFVKILGQVVFYMNNLQ